MGSKCKTKSVYGLIFGLSKGVKMKKDTKSYINEIKRMIDNDNNLALETVYKMQVFDKFNHLTASFGCCQRCLIYVVNSDWTHYFYYRPSMSQPKCDICGVEHIAKKVRLWKS